MEKSRRKLLGFAKSICLGILAVLLLCSSMKSYAAMGTEEVAVVALYGERPLVDKTGEILDDCKKGETVTDACFLWNGGIETIEEPRFSHSTDARITAVVGAGELYDNACVALDENDKNGCILDRGSAVDLFGSENCVGDQLRLGDKIYEVRAVAAWNLHQVLVRTVKKESVCTQVLIRRRQEQSLESAASGFLIRYGLRGILVDDRWVKMLASCVLAVYVFVVMILIKKLLDKKTEYNFADRNCIRFVKYGKKEGIRLAQTVILWGLGLFLIFRILYISRDWLPDKWSDFSFWPEKIKKERELIRWYFMLPKTVGQTERLFGGIGCILKCGAATLLTVLLYGRILERKS